MSNKAMPAIVAADLRITGNLSSDGDIQVEGAIKGDVKGRTLTVGDGGSIQGKIVAEEVMVRGKIKGQIKAKKVNLTRSASVTADIEFISLGIEEGADFEGNIKRMADA